MSGGTGSRVSSQLLIHRYVHGGQGVAPQLFSSPRSRRGEDLCLGPLHSLESSMSAGFGLFETRMTSSEASFLLRQARGPHHLPAQLPGGTAPTASPLCELHASRSTKVTWARAGQVHGTRHHGQGHSESLALSPRAVVINEVRGVQL